MILSLWALWGQAQTLCEQHGSAPADVTIGTPINAQNQQSVTFLSANFPNGATFQNQKIRINGILKIDRNLSLLNCRVEMERGAQIVTDGNNWILGSGSDFYSCGQMWQGIYIKTGGSAGIYSGRIEDAEAAVTMDDGTGVGIVGMTFNRNHIGIRNGSATVGVSSVNLILFGDNTFDCTAALLPPFSSSLSPAYTGTSYSGIHLNTAVGTVPGHFDINYFRNMHFGITLENADAHIERCDFRSMVQHPTIQNGSHGIRSIGGALSVNRSNFDLLNHGIWAEGSELNITNNTFTVTRRTGITSTLNLNTDFISILNNQFTITNAVGAGLKTAIRVDRNSRSSAGNPNLASFDISGNAIAINGLGVGANPQLLQQRGIWVFSPVPSLDIGLISGNTVTATAAVDQRQNCIEVDAGLGDRFRVLGNNVTYAGGIIEYRFRFGISMHFGQGINHRLQNNTSFGTPNNRLGGTCGIHLTDMPNVTVCNNTVDNFEHGFHFYGPCNGLGYWGNTMNAHFRASVRVQDNLQNLNIGFIGTHTLTTNRWNNAEAATDNSSWQGMPLNRLDLPQNILPFSPTAWTPFGFLTFVMGQETACMQPPTIVGEGEGELTDYDKWAAGGASGAGTASAWEEKRKLMFKLLRFPSLVSLDASVNNFYNAEYNTTLGKLAQAEHLFFSSVQQVTEAQNNSISTYGDERALLLEQLHNMDEANSSISQTEVPSSSLISAKQALLNTWKTNLSNRSLLKQQIAAQRQVQIQQAQQLLISISTTSVQEANWKTIFGVRFNNALGISASETVLNQLRGIAAQCPEEAGGSAIAAIYMLPEEEAALLIPQEQIGLLDNCGEPRASGSEISDHPSVIRLSPNPAQDKLLVDLPNESSGAWEVFDLTGQIISDGSFTQAQTFTIQTEQLQNGAYLLSVRLLNGDSHAHKFIISK